MKIKVKVAHSEAPKTEKENLISDSILLENNIIEFVDNPIGISFSEPELAFESEEEQTHVNSNQAAYDRQHDKSFANRLDKMLHSNTIPWRNYLVYLILITSLSCAVTFSKYISRVGTEATVTAAKFDVQISAEKLNNSNFESGTIGFDRIDRYSIIKYTVRNESEVSVKATMLVSGNAGCDYSVVDLTDLSKPAKEANGYTTPVLAPGDYCQIPLRIVSSKTGTASGSLNVRFDYEQVN